MEEQKAVSEVEGKEVAEVSDEELATLMAEGKRHQDAENAGDGVKADYILLAKSGISNQHLLVSCKECLTDIFPVSSNF